MVRGTDKGNTITREVVEEEEDFMNEDDFNILEGTEHHQDPPAQEGIEDEFMTDLLEVNGTSVPTSSQVPGGARPVFH